MSEVSVIIPNYNGIAFLPACLNALLKQSFTDFETILVDNGSSDGSTELIRQDYSWVRMITLDRNYGFCRAVNEGIRASSSPYVILLNNDTRADQHFVEELLKAIRKNRRRFSCQAKMVQMQNPSVIDDAGDFYTALGWAYARGKGRPEKNYRQEREVFSCCGGASIYRREIFEEIGYFDEAHFAYLEDTDIGYRAKICGYHNIFVPSAVVAHVGSAASGSRYNLFKTRLSSRNNIYLVYKNMPLAQILLNLPFLAAGFLIKALFFLFKRQGLTYIRGLANGFKLSTRKQKFQFRIDNIPNYIRIQLELWLNILRILKR